MDADSKPPPCKKYKASDSLKSFTANVKVIVGKGKEKSMHLYHAYQLASISPWIDEQLSDMMEEEKESYEIILEDIATETWLAMAKFALCTLEARKMKKEDVELVVDGYHKYNFAGGLALCDQVLTEFMRTLEEQEKRKTLQIGNMASTVATAHRYHLSQANEIGGGFVKKIMVNKSSNQIQQTDFSPSDIKMLVPVLESLSEQDSSFPQKLFPSHSSFYKCETVEDIKNPMFPHLYCASWQSAKTGDYVREEVHHYIKLTGAIWDGEPIGRTVLEIKSPSTLEYTQDEKTVFLAGVPYRIEVVYCSTAGWQIVGVREGEDEEEDQERGVLWESAVGGKHGSLPPKDGFVPVSPLASGKPRIEYK